MQRTDRFRTLSLAAAGARQLEMKGKDAGAVAPRDIDVAEETLQHARIIGDAIRFARKLLFRGVSNNARLVNCREQVRARAIKLLTAELEAINRRITDPWAQLVARCNAIAKYGIGHCHECSDLTFLYLAVKLPGLKIDQLKYSGRDHVATLVASDKHEIRCDPWTTVAVPVLQGHGNKKLDVNLGEILLDSISPDGGPGSGKLLRTCKELTPPQRRLLERAVAELDRLTPARCLSDKNILQAPAPPTTTRTGAAMDDGSLWPLSKSRPVTGFVHGNQRFDVDTYSVNEYFHALFNRLPRRGDRPFPAGCFDFSDAIERLLVNDKDPLLSLVDEHGFDARATAPLLAELLDLAIHDEPTREEALRLLNAIWPIPIEQISS